MIAVPGPYLSRIGRPDGVMPPTDEKSRPPERVNVPATVLRPEMLEKLLVGPSRRTDAAAPMVLRLTAVTVRVAPSNTFHVPPVKVLPDACVSPPLTLKVP